MPNPQGKKVRFLRIYRAIIVPISGDPHHVPLPSIALADMKILKDRFTRAISDKPRGVEDGSHSALADNMGPDHTAHHQRTPACPQTKAPLSNLAVSDCSFHTSIPLQSSPVSNKGGSFWEGAMPGRQLIKKCVPPSFVAIGQGQPGAGTDKALLAVDSEPELAHKLVPPTANRTTISGDKATRACALEALQQNTWVHLACHGKQDPAQPYNSSREANI